MTGIQLLTIAQVAEALGTNPQAVYRRIWAKEIKAVNIGTGTKSRLRVRTSDLERYVNDRELAIPSRRRSVA